MQSNGSAEWCVPCGPRASTQAHGLKPENKYNAQHLTPRTDIWRNTDKIVVRVYMPGVELSSAEVDVEDETLTILGKVSEFVPEGLTPVHQESRSGSYFRSFKLGDEIDVERIEALMKDGLLTLTLPISERAKPKKIEVRIV
jgi:HSP20 family protein